MRLIITILGALAIVTYAVLGALLMNDWAVAAASEMPLDAAIDEMNAANQPYSVAPGIVFATVGTLLAVAWGVLVMIRKLRISAWAALSIWAAIITLGAPAYFAASFGNLNSVGDTFYEWNSGAAFALEVPLYLTSGVAALLTVVAVIMAVVQAQATKVSGRQ